MTAGTVTFFQNQRHLLASHMRIIRGTEQNGTKMLRLSTIKMIYIPHVPIYL
jgi:hypothetical protein